LLACSSNITCRFLNLKPRNPPLKTIITAIGGRFFHPNGFYNAVIVYRLRPKWIQAHNPGCVDIRQFSKDSTWYVGVIFVVHKVSDFNWCHLFTRSIYATAESALKTCTQAKNTHMLHYWIMDSLAGNSLVFTVELRFGNVSKQYLLWFFLIIDLRPLRLLFHTPSSFNPFQPRILAVLFIYVLFCICSFIHSARL
jgi:hypothetical protein